jgi:opacity protein-like surface antigen
MKKLIIAMFALVAGASVAFAADLPSKSAPAAPSPVSTSAFDLSGWYVGGFAGGNFAKWSSIDLNTTSKVFGGVAGYEWNKYLRTELTADYNTQTTPTTTSAGQTVFANATVGYPVGFGFTPYVLGGVGYGWGSWDRIVGTNKDRTLYNIGGGIRYDIARNWELDARYRYIQSLTDNKFNNNQIVTMGVNYKF